MLVCGFVDSLSERLLLFCEVKTNLGACQFVENGMFAVHCKTR